MSYGSQLKPFRVGIYFQGSSMSVKTNSHMTRCHVAIFCLSDAYF
jgi:hypothetical protein